MSQISEIHYLIQSSEKRSLEYNDDNKELIITENLNSWLEIFNGHNLEFEERSNGTRLLIQTKKFDFSLFWTIQEYKQEVSDFDLNHDILIVNDLDCIKFDHKSGTTDHPQNTELAYIFSNAQVFFESLKFFKNRSNSENEHEDFVDFYSETTRKIIFNSSKGAGKVIFSIPQAGIINLDPNLDISQSWSDFQKIFNETNKNFPYFVKAALINQLSTTTTNTFEVFFQKIDAILKEAKLNHSIYLSELSIDNLKRDYKEYKNSYFEHVNSLLGKLVNQVIALPITFVGATFAVGKIDNDPFLYCIIMIALMVASIYVIFLIGHYKDDLEFINKGFTTDYVRIEGSSFFKEHPDELEEFNDVKVRMQQKSLFLKYFLNTYYWVTIIFNLFLIVFISKKLVLTVSFMIGVSITLSILSFIYFLLFITKLKQKRSKI